MAEFHGQGFQNLGLVMVGRDLNIVAGPRDAPRDSATLLKVRSTDPRDDKARIEQQKGRLLRNSYEWILSHGDFLRWRDGEGYQLLWIRGDPGKGKTMLVCGIINELNEARESGYNIAYFFCQATNFQLRKATFVLQGLIFSLISQQPDLLDFVRDDIDQASSDLFQDLNGWAALCRIFNRLTEETERRRQVTYILVDALDECLEDRSQLMKWIAGLSSPGIKILVSSRNWPSIESGLSTATQRVALHLELNGEAISNAVDLYIDHKVKGLERPKDLNEETRETIKRHLKSYSNNTFLWVALVCQELDREDTYPWRIDDMLREFPPGLNELYQRMAMYFFASDEAEICREVLAVQTLAYRPLTLTELSSLVKCSEMFAERWLQKVVELCGSFLTVKADTIYFVHQSAKEYLIQNMPKSLFPQGALAAGHRTMVIRSIQTLSKALRENMYQLPSLGSRVDNVTVPSPDPLSGIHYACVYWADHLIDAESIEKRDVDDGKLVRQFLEKHILHWFEALSLLKSLGLGITALTKIMSSIQTSVKGSTGDVTSLVTFESLNSTAESISQRRIHRRIERRHSKRNEKELESPGSGDMKALWNLIYDAWRLIRHHKVGIESAPLQVYSSALIFSPACSLVRQIFLKAPASLPMIQTAGSHWNPCLQALEGHTGPIQSVAFALNGKYMASTSADGTTRIWDATTGECLNILQGHVNDTIKISPSPPWNRAHDPWQSIAFSPNSELLALSSGDGIIQIWDTLMGVWQQTLKDDLSDPSKSRVRLPKVAFCGDKSLISIDNYHAVYIWNLATGGCLKRRLRDVVRFNTVWGTETPFSLSRNGRVAAWLTMDQKEENFRVEILDISTGQYHETPWHRKQTRPCRVSMSVDGELVIYGPTSYDMFHIRHINADRRMFPETSIRVSNISEFVDVLVLSPDGRFLVAAGYGRVVECEISTGQHAILSRQTGDAEYLSALEYSPDGTLLVSGSRRGLVQVLEMTAFRTQPEWSHTAKHQINLALSTDGNFLGFAGRDDNVQVWDLAKNERLSTIAMPCGRTGDKCVITFSPDGKQVLRSCDVLLADGHSKFITELFDAATGHRLWAIYESRSYIEPHINKFSGDGTRLANGRGHAVNIRDAATGTCLSKVTIPSTGIWALSSDGTKLATIPCRYFHNPTQHPPHLHRIRISDIATGSYRCLENMFDSYYCSSITFSPDDGYIVLMSNNYLFPNNYTCIVHAATGALLKRLVGFECSGLRIAGLQTSHGIYDTQALLDDPRGRIEYNSNDILEGTLSGIGITSERDWITKNGKPFLWIPPEDRRIHSLDQYNRNIAIAGNTIAFYYPTGQIYCIRLCSSSAGCNRPVYSSVNEFNTFLLSPTTRQT